ncbi:MAG: DUF4242 domain-containing protein [Gemmatimonadetes bacterium]|nr:DUF4242 domain-containing protein [Gemmatimonadota bacterium]
MPKFLIERNVPGAGQLSSQQLHGIAETSCSVLQAMGPQIQWVQSFVTGDKITCVYIAPDEEMLREHARRGGFPADAVLEVKAIIDPTTAESPAPPVSIPTPA